MVFAELGDLQLRGGSGRAARPAAGGRPDPRSRRAADATRADARARRRRCHRAAGRDAGRRRGRARAIPGHRSGAPSAVPPVRGGRAEGAVGRCGGRTCGAREASVAAAGGRHRRVLLHEDRHAPPEMDDLQGRRRAGQPGAQDASSRRDGAGRSAGRRPAGLPARPERRADARRVEIVSHRPRRVSPGPRRARGRRLPRGARTRAGAARAARRVHAIALPARVALSPLAGGRVPGHQRRAVAAGLAPRAVVARGPQHGAGPAAGAHDLRRRRPQAVDLRVPRRRCPRAGARRGADPPVARRRRRQPRDSSELSRRAAAAGVHQRPLHGRRQAPGTRRRVHLRRAR